jgi:membrane protein
VLLPASLCDRQAPTEIDSHGEGRVDDVVPATDVSLGGNVPDARWRSVFGRASGALRQFGRSVWRRDRGRLRGWAALATRLARVLTWTIRGFVVNELSVRAAALAYYTLFSIVPVLVMALWTLKLLHLVPHLMPHEGAHPIGSGQHLPEADGNGNALLREALRAILASVNRAGRLETGVVGWGALLYGVARLIRHAQVALDTIGGARNRPREYWRLFGYLALLLLPPALFIVSGLLRRLANAPLGDTVTGVAAQILEAVPVLKSVLSAAVGLAILCLALTIFYASAARARIALRSSLVGASVAALFLVAVLKIFAAFQIGAARAGALASGMAALPVFLLWSFFSWLVILLGAQIADAHQRDCILVHGAPDPLSTLGGAPSS